MRIWVERILAKVGGKRSYIVCNSIEENRGEWTVQGSNLQGNVHKLFYSDARCR